LTSSAFTAGGPIPQKYSCDGADASTPLQWTDPPAGTQSFALIFDDPDAVPVAGFVWVHWIVYNLPPHLRGLSEGADLSDGGTQGTNSWTRQDYGGPCPPDGTHRYFYKLYALDTILDLNPGIDKAGLLEAMEGHVLAEAELMGTYTR
jgi:Raf kinase inhibitor-like YbhB/YbcL family protein